MKSLSETVKDGEQRKRQLQEQIDQLNEECAKLAAQGRLIFYVGITMVGYEKFSVLVCCYYILSLPCALLYQV